MAGPEADVDHTYGRPDYKALLEEVILAYRSTYAGRLPKAIKAAEKALEPPKTDPAQGSFEFSGNRTDDWFYGGNLPK